MGSIFGPFLGRAPEVQFGLTSQGKKILQKLRNLAQRSQLVLLDLLRLRLSSKFCTQFDDLCFHFCAGVDPASFDVLSASLDCSEDFGVVVVGDGYFFVEVEVEVSHDSILRCHFFARFLDESDVLAGAFGEDFVVACFDCGGVDEFSADGYGAGSGS